MKNNNKNIYNRTYSASTEYKYKTQTRWQRHLITRMERHMDAKQVKKILDIGCGKGLNTVFFAEDYPEASVIGLDFSEVGINKARENYASVANLSFLCSDAMDLKSGENTRFSLVCAFELLEHLEEWEPLALKMTELSDKYILVSAPVGRMRAYEVEIAGHFRNFKRGELEAFFNQYGFETVKTFYAGFPFYSPITRDLLTLGGSSPGLSGKELSFIEKQASLLIYFLYRYCSTINRGGDQFMGLFKKTE